MKGLRLRFSIRHYLVATLVVGVVIGLRLFLDPRLYWRDLWAVFLFALMGTLTWFAVVGPWTARCFTLGFVFGAILEHAVLDQYSRHDLIRYTPGVWTPEGWYPFSLPLERTFITLGWATLAEPPLLAGFTGMALSGILCGGTLLVVCLWWQSKAR